MHTSNDPPPESLTPPTADRHATLIQNCFAATPGPARDMTFADDLRQLNPYHPSFDLEDDSADSSQDSEDQAESDEEGKEGGEEDAGGLVSPSSAAVGVAFETADNALPAADGHGRMISSGTGGSMPGEGPSRERGIQASVADPARSRKRARSEDDEDDDDDDEVPNDANESSSPAKKSRVHNNGADDHDDYHYLRQFWPRFPPSPPPPLHHHPFPTPSLTPPTPPSPTPFQPRLRALARPARISFRGCIYDDDDHDYGCRELELVVGTRIELELGPESELEGVDVNGNITVNANVYNL
ncbi:hypothetical protein MMC24_001168 [Lignoscripta atroalba]|nr:hypothetical protein [Lignoscripta atroalba]